MKYLIIILVLIISGCTDGNGWIVNCDSEFSTGNSRYAYIDDGVISWEDDHGRWTSRKMIGGEVCKVTRIKAP